MKKNLVFVFATIIISVFAISVNAKEFDLSNVTEVYRNTFDNEASLDEFSQYGGKWKVNGGRLYLTSGTNNHAFILYTGNEELTTLTDYVIDVDMYNVRSQAGVIVRSDLNYITSGSNGFAGYFAFISFTGKKGAIGIANRAGGWGGNLEVGEEITKPGMDLHLRVVAFKNNIHYTISDLATKKVLWEHTEVHSEYASGSFGFRMSSMIYDGMVNLWSTSFDNLVVSKFNEEEMPFDEDFSDDTFEGLFQSNTDKMMSIIFLSQILGGEVEYDIANGIVTVRFPIEDFNIPIQYEDLMSGIISSRLDF